MAFACGDSGAELAPAMSSPSDPSADAAKPEIVQISRVGQDRFYGVTYDDAGAIYAVGQITNSTDASADTSLLITKFTADGTRDPASGAPAP